MIADGIAKAFETMTTAPPATARARARPTSRSPTASAATGAACCAASRLQIAEGESYGLVGESGCGKSTAAFAALRYLPRNGRVSSGGIHVAGEDLLAMSDADVRRLRATKVSMVYQNPTAALNPSIRIGDQVAEVLHAPGRDRRARRTSAARAMLGEGPDLRPRRGSCAATRTSSRAA